MLWIYLRISTRVHELILRIVDTASSFAVTQSGPIEHHSQSDNSKTRRRQLQHYMKPIRASRNCRTLQLEQFPHSDGFIIHSSQTASATVLRGARGEQLAEIAPPAAGSQCPTTTRKAVGRHDATRRDDILTRSN